MKETEILDYIRSKGYEAEKIYSLAAEVYEEDGTPVHKESYRVLVMKDFPISDREPRRWFEGESLSELFDYIKRVL